MTNYRYNEKQQEDDVRHQEQQKQREALKQLERDQPKKYQKLYKQVACDLGINLYRPKRGDKRNIIFKIIEDIP